MVLFSVEEVGLLKQSQEQNTSLRTLLRTWPRKGIKRGDALALSGVWQLVEEAIINEKEGEVKVKVRKQSRKDRVDLVLVATQAWCIKSEM